MKNENKSMNNKGFSLVELIIVIAIMAVLAAALAPQLMKYVEKSRKSSDASTCASIESTINAALAIEDVYSGVMAASSPITVTVTKSGVACTVTDLKKELDATLKKTSSPKVKGGTQFICKITTTTDGIADVTCNVCDASGNSIEVRES